MVSTQHTTRMMVSGMFLTLLSCRKGNLKERKDLNKKYPKGKIKIDATYVVSFKAGKGLKGALMEKQTSNLII